VSYNVTICYIGLYSVLQKRCNSIICYKVVVWDARYNVLMLTFLEDRNKQTLLFHDTKQQRLQPVNNIRACYFR